MDTLVAAVIDLVSCDDTEQALRSATPDLAGLLAGLPRTLVGAQMVILHAFEVGEIPGRTTDDLNLFFDVRAYVGATGEATRWLLRAGFIETRPSPDGVAHRFTRDVVVVDVLAPDGLGTRTSSASIVGGRTVHVPGGSRAFGTDRNRGCPDSEIELAKLPRPSLLGAILLKARAVGAAA